MIRFEQPDGHRPRHRRNATVRVGGDLMSQADCISSNGYVCRANGTICPRHHAEAYADHMARHAIDSLPLPYGVPHE